MSEQSERKHTRGTPTGSTLQQVGKRSMSPTSGAMLKIKFYAAPSANTGVPLMLLSEKDNFFLHFGVPLVCFLSDCSLILVLTKHFVLWLQRLHDICMAYGCSMHHVQYMYLSAPCIHITCDMRLHVICIYIYIYIYIAAAQITRV